MNVSLLRTHRPGRLVAALFAASVALWTGGPVRADNVLANGDFDHDVDSWLFYPEALEVTWSPIDIDGSASSGSALATSVDPIDNNGYTSMSTCVPVVPGLEYEMGASYFIPAGQSREVFVFVGTSFYTSADCRGGRLGRHDSGVGATVGSWEELSVPPVVAPADARSVEIFPALRKVGDGGSARGHWDRVYVRAENLCSPGADRLCLHGGRFRVQADFRDFEGNPGQARSVPLSQSSGLLWFFDEGNIEMLVKVLDTCSFTDRFWVFAAATTDVEYTLRVTDVVAQETRTYQNPLGTASPAITDTGAFDTCPP